MEIDSEASFFSSLQRIVYRLPCAKQCKNFNKKNLKKFDLMALANEHFMTEILIEKRQI